VYCSDDGNRNMDRIRIKDTKVISPIKCSMNFRELSFTSCIVLLHGKIAYKNVLDHLIKSHANEMYQPTFSVSGSTCHKQI
jgi:hypothetical protein